VGPRFESWRAHAGSPRYRGFSVFEGDDAAARVATEWATAVTRRAIPSRCLGGKRDPEVERRCEGPSVEVWTSVRMSSSIRVISPGG
jgi:hypothetical protein